MLGVARQARPHPVRAGRRSRPARGGSVRACSDEAADQDQGGGAARRHLAPGSMTMARIDDLKAKTDDQLDEELGNLKREAFNLRFQAATNQLEKPSRVRVVRRDIARIKTLQNGRAAEVALGQGARPRPAAKYGGHAYAERTGGR